MTKLLFALLFLLEGLEVDSLGILLDFSLPLGRVYVAVLGGVVLGLLVSGNGHGQTAFLLSQF